MSKKIEIKTVEDYLALPEDQQDQLMWYLPISFLDAIQEERRKRFVNDLITGADLSEEDANSFAEKMVEVAMRHADNLILYGNGQGQPIEAYDPEDSEISDLAISMNNDYQARELAKLPAIKNLVESGIIKE